MRQPCELFSLIPRDKLDYLFRHSEAFAELDFTFFCFEEIYREVLHSVPKDMVILDLGCAYATQSYFFRDHAKYIGVEPFKDNDSVIHTENSEFFFTTIQDFISRILPSLGLDLNQVFAVCSYVPDFAASDLVMQTFPHHRVFYPGATDVWSLPKSVSLKPSLSDQISGAAERTNQAKPGNEPTSPAR